MSSSIALLGRSHIGLALLVALFVGCQRDLNTVYGQRGGIGHTSVNGTAALGEMFDEYGHDVSSRTWLSPAIQRRADVIVWFPDDFDPPRQEVVDWLSDWLAEQPDRTLIYVGRDYDAAPAYWKAVAPLAPQGQRAKFETELKGAELARDGRRQQLVDGQSCDWFTIEAQGPARRVTDVDGLSDWAEWQGAFDVKQADIQMQGRLRPADYFAVELESRGDPIISRTIYENDSQILIVNNGSFLLNLPLVNAEHRKLAGMLIEQVGEDRNVVFLESGPGGPPLKEQETDAPPSLLNLFTVAPFDGIFLHLAVVGGVAALCLWPIFGPPSSGGATRLSDFGRHITALGALLQRTGDRAFAEAAVNRFHDQQAERRMPTRRGRSR